MMRLSVALWIVLASTVGCQRNEAGPEAPSEAPPVTNRIPVPPEVISNIGITFETARRGKLGRWLRVPGRLEVPQDRRWTVRAPAVCRVRPRVRVGQAVDQDTVLVVLESPALRAAQKSLLTSARAIQNAEVEAHSAVQRLSEAESLWTHTLEFEEKSKRRRTRVQELIDEAAGSSSGAFSSKELLEAERALVDARKRTLEAAVARDDLRTRSRNLALEVERARIEFDQQLASLAVLTGSPVSTLTSVENGKPIWQTLAKLELRSPGTGLVMAVTVADGEHVAAAAPLITVFDASTLAFRGHLPESDLGALKPGAPVRIEAAGTESEPILSLLWESPPTFHENSRTVEVSAWVANPAARFPHGLSATAQVQVAESEAEEVLLLEACVVFDGLEAVVFRRDPDEPDVVIRTPVELGEHAAGHVEVLAGVLDGDEVVSDGAHQLKQTGLGKAPAGGHFHADGSWHEEH